MQRPALSATSGAVTRRASTAAVCAAIQARHLRRVRQAQHEAARTLIGWAVQHRIGTLAVRDPRGVLAGKAGRRHNHNQRVRDWRIGHLIRAEAAGITVTLVDERGPSGAGINAPPSRDTPAWRAPCTT